jgi:hypothetical protein
LAEALRACGEIAERSDAGIYIERILCDGLEGAPISEVDAIVPVLLDDPDEPAQTTLRPVEAVQQELLGDSPTLRPGAPSTEPQTVLGPEPLAAADDACDESSVRPSHDLAAFELPSYKKRQLALVAGVAASVALLLLWSLGGRAHTTPPRATVARVPPASNVAAAQPPPTPALSPEQAPVAPEPERGEVAATPQTPPSGAVTPPARRVAPAAPNVSARPRRGLRKSSPANGVFVPDDI